MTYSWMLYKVVLSSVCLSAFDKVCHECQFVYVGICFNACEFQTANFYVSGAANANGFFSEWIVGSHYNFTKILNSY